MLGWNVYLVITDIFGFYSYIVTVCCYRRQRLQFASNWCFELSQPQRIISALSLIHCVCTLSSHGCYWLAPRSHLHVVGMLRFMSDINQPSLPAPLYFVLVSISVFMTLSTVFRPLNSPDNSPFSDSVLPVLFLPHWSFQLYIYIYLYESRLLPCYNPLWLTGLKAPAN